MLLILCICLSACSKDMAAKTPDGAGASTDEASNDMNPVDVDLTKLSNIMVYSEVDNMVTYPDKYLGKTIRLRGPYYALFDEGTKNYYHFIIIEDATACCEQGLEFVWEGEHRYPEDYPADTTRVEIIGTYSSYEELGETYFYIQTEQIEILN